MGDIVYTEDQSWIQSGAKEQNKNVSGEVVKVSEHRCG